jgi:threonine synthase
MDSPNIFCTICGIDFDDAGLERICEHQNLPVPVCAPCFDDIDKKVKRARSNNDYCAWCGEGLLTHLC